VVQLTAAYALDRITGARLYEKVDVPPETIAVADVAEPDVASPRSARCRTRRAIPATARRTARTTP